MSLQIDLIAHLVAMDTEVKARVYHEQIDPDAALPFIALSEITGTTGAALSGARLFNRSTIRVSIFAIFAVQTDRIAREIKDSMHGFRGFMGSTNISSIRIETSSDEVTYVDGDKIIKGKNLDLYFVYY